MSRRVHSPTIWVVAFIVGYAVLRFAESLWTTGPPTLSPFDLAAGFGVAVLARSPRLTWPIMAVAALAIGLVCGILVDLPPTLALAWAAIAVVEMLAMATLLWVFGVRRISRWEHLAIVVAVAAGIAALGATLAISADLWVGTNASGALWRTWWVGQTAGVILIAPAVLAARLPGRKLSLWRIVEFSVVCAMAVGLTAWVFGSHYSNLLGAWGAQYLLVPLLLWIAVRFGLAISACALTLLNVVGITTTINGFGPFAALGTPSGSLLTLQVSMILVGLAVYAVAINEEQRRSSEYRLLAAHAVVDSLLENSDAMIAVKEYGGETDGVYTLANSRFATSLGLSVGQIVGRTDVELFSAQDATSAMTEDLEVLAARRSKVFMTRSPIGSQRTDHDGQILLVTKFPLTDADGKLRAVGSIALDITEHRRRERLMRLTFDKSPIPMARLAWRDGHAGQILDANRSFAQLVGVPVSHLIGSSIDRFTHPEERGIPIIPTEGQHGAPRRHKARLAGPDGAEIWVAVTANIVEPDRADDELDDAFALVILEDITAQHVAEMTLKQQALHDALTGVLNRYAFLDRLEGALKRLYRTPSFVAVLFCDLDGFKDLNDTLGHHAGDQMLISVSERLRAVMRPHDTLARLGGDEFVLVCEDLTSPGEARMIGDRIREAIRVPFRIDNREYGMSISVGVATTTDPATKAEDLLRRADLAMYKAKDNGRNRVEYYVEELETRVFAQVEATEMLRRAIAEDRVRAHYQPIVSLATGEVVGVEALARIVDDSGQLRTPEDFIGVAESSGLVVPLGESVLDIALYQLTQWREAGINLALNVNVSPRQLARASFAPAVFERLMARGIAPDLLCLEVTEGAVVDATGPTLITLRRLRSYGVHVGIDDFGTGYSSLTTLKYLPADVLKVDRSFVEGLGRDPQDTAIVGAVIRVAHDLGRIVVAEGVETEIQAEVLRTMGCDQVQGFLYGRPVAADEVQAMLDRLAK